MTLPFTAEALEPLYARGVLGAIDLHFGRALARLCPGELGAVALAGALTSRAVQAGHVCLDLTHPPTLLDQEEQPLELAWPGLEPLRALLERSPAVARDERRAPLVLRGSGLYLFRYADYEARLARALTDRTDAVFPLDEAFLRERFAHHFGPLATSGELDLQRLAALLALRHRFTVISGGPGTGKTTTVAKLLVLLQEHSLRQGRPLRIELLAPTGKAAQRLSESLQRGLATAGVPMELRRQLPDVASTIHRALGHQRQTPTRFRRDRQRPLDCDVVIVDEASMVDLALMAKLVEAIPDQTRLILLGDKNQLSSVEAGAIFADILGPMNEPGYSKTVVDLAERVLGQRPPLLQSVGKLSDHRVELQKSHRYRDDSGIGRVASALRQGDAEATLFALTANEGASLVLGEDATTLEAAIVEGYRAYADAVSAEERLSRLGEFRILSPHRHGPTGVSGLNATAERALGAATRLRPAAGPYEGQPILVLENEYQLELFNGDIGVIGRVDDGPRLVAFFPGSTGVRTVPLSRLPAHETAFAMTVHKSQGSEFERVLLVLPSQASPVLTRELLYTGITRAKTSVRIVGSTEILRMGIETRIQRSSGLGDHLWRSDGEGSPRAQR